jgi:hypothetical protein
MKRTLGSSTALAYATLALLAGTADAGTWPVARHDAARTASAASVLPMAAPKVKWRAYMGGHPNDASVRFGLPSSALLVANAGGRFVAKDASTQQIAWTSALLGEGRVVDIADVNGDGVAEIVVATTGRVHVLSAGDGAVLWSSSPDAFQIIGAVFAVDMNGDGVRDVYVDSGHGAKAGTKSAAAYSFAAGFAAPAELWSRAADAKPQELSAGTDAVFDLDADGVPEVAIATATSMLVLRGSDGAQIAALDAPSASGWPFGQAFALAADLDDEPGRELLVVVPEGQVATKLGPTGLTAYRLNPSTGQSQLLWTASTGAYDAEVVTVADLASDLDGDGKKEIVFSFRNLSGGSTFTTEILDGATGAVRAQLPGSRFEGAADLDGQPGAEIVTASAAGLAVHRFAAGVLTPIGAPLPGLRALTLEDPALHRHVALDRRLAIVSRPGQPPALVVGHPAGAQAYSDLAAARALSDVTSVTVGAQGLALGPSYAPAIGQITGAIRADYATRPYPQIAVGTTYGTVDVLDAAMQVTNGAINANDPPSGTRIGGAMQPSTGAYGGPLVGFDPNGPLVVLPGSAKGLEVVDADSASWVVPPVPRWAPTPMGSASIIDLGAPLGTAVVGVEGTSLVARSSMNGAVLGARPLGLGIPWGVPLPLRTGGAHPLVGIDWRTAGVQIVQMAVDFHSGTTAWTGAPLPYGGFFASGVGDLDGDGVDEWYSMNGPLNRRMATTGQTTTFPELTTGYALPMVATFTGGSEPDLLLQSGAPAPKLATSALTQAWAAPQTEAMNGMAGTRVVCQGVARFVTPAVLSPVLRAFAGASGSLLGEGVLAGGAVYPSLVAATDAGARPGFLSNASSVTNLGQHNPTVLVGSSDGYLYAIDGCTLDLQWAVNLGAPVAEPVVGNTDGSQADEIVVGAADGYVYAIGLPPYHAPSVTLQDASDGAFAISVGESVTASWGNVEGATSYEVALVGPDDRPLWNPAYKSVQGTSITIAPEGALAGRPYRLAVRARGLEGASDDAFSPSFSIRDLAAPALLHAAAKSSAGAAPASITFDASDDLALDHYAVTMHAVGEDTVYTATDGMLSGASASTTASFLVPSELRGHMVMVKLRVLDSARNASVRSFEGLADENGGIAFIGANGEDEGAAPDDAALNGAPKRPGPGKGCSTSPEPAGSTGSALSALCILGAYAVARRRRRARLG